MGTVLPPQHPSRLRPPRTTRGRTVALAATVVIAVLVPVAAALAGSVLPEADVEHLTPVTRSFSAPASSALAPTGSAGLSGPSGVPEPSGSAAAPRSGSSSAPASEGDARTADGPAGEGDRAGHAGKSGRVTSVCGPQLVSRAGVEAQTCVLAEGDRTWARMYFRNATNAQLHGVLTLMRPDGRTVRVRCVLPAAQRPGQCQTPRERTVAEAKALDPGNQLGYTAVAEIASPDGNRLLLRSGSNSEHS